MIWGWVILQRMDLALTYLFKHMILLLKQGWKPHTLSARTSLSMYGFLFVLCSKASIV